jgi:hypothetical protein
MESCVVKAYTFPNNRYYFFKTGEFLGFRGILDFVSGRPLERKLMYEDYGTEELYFHKKIAQMINSHKFVERVSFYGGGVDILIKKEHIDYCKISHVVTAVKFSIEEVLGYKIIVTIDSR